MQVLLGGPFEPRTAHARRRVSLPVALAAVLPLIIGAPEPASLPNESGWPWAARWAYPVGDSTAWGEPDSQGAPPFRVTRNVSRGRGNRPHQGADLSNRRAGDVVRAAAPGWVLAAGPGRRGNGFGWHVALAHRLPNGEFAYSVYGHLIAGSVTVAPGQSVVLGQTLGRVGETGRAYGPHLHFEVRRPRVLGERWEAARPVDPIEWIGDRRLEPRMESAAIARLLAWGESIAAIESGTAPEALLDRSTWWRMLAAALASEIDPTRGPLETRRRLEEARILPADGARLGGAPCSEAELESALRALSLRDALAPPPETSSAIESDPETESVRESRTISLRALETAPARSDSMFGPPIPLTVVRGLDRLAQALRSRPADRNLPGASTPAPVPAGRERRASP